jgi:hypothetical protein
LREAGLHNIADRGTIGPRKFLRLAEKNGGKTEKTEKSKEKERMEEQKGRK